MLPIIVMRNIFFRPPNTRKCPGCQANWLHEIPQVLYEQGKDIKLTIFVDEFTLFSPECMFYIHTKYLAICKLEKKQFYQFLLIGYLNSINDQNIISTKYIFLNLTNTMT